MVDNLDRIECVDRVKLGPLELVAGIERGCQLGEKERERERKKEIYISPFFRQRNLK